MLYLYLENLRLHPYLYTILRHDHGPMDYTLHKLQRGCERERGRSDR